MVRLILIRHGETAWNAEQRYQGQTDVPLSNRGKRQVMALAKQLAGEEIHAIYASDLQRAWDTATSISAYHTAPLHAEPRLREMDFGAWEGLTYAEIQERYPDTLAAWQDNPMRTTTPDGEGMAEVVSRVQHVLDDLTDAHRDQTVLLVAHGGSLQVLLCLALGLVPQARWQFRLDAGSVSELYLYEEGAVLTLLNDTCHLLEENDAG